MIFFEENVNYKDKDLSDENLYIAESNITKLNSLPQKIKNLYIKNCPNLKEIDSEIEIKGEFSIFNCPKLTKINGIKKAKIIQVEKSGIQSLEWLPSKGIEEIRISNCPLKSLKGSPKSVKIMVIKDTKLKTLEGSPEIVDGSFIIQSNTDLKSLKGAPKKVKINFDCSYCYFLESFDGIGDVGRLTAKFTKVKNLKGIKKVKFAIDIVSSKEFESFEGIPKNFKGSLFVSNTFKLKSMKGLPKKMEQLYIQETSLNSLKYCPDAKKIVLSRNQIETLEDIPENINDLILWGNPIKKFSFEAVLAYDEEKDNIALDSEVKKKFLEFYNNLKNFKGIKISKKYYSKITDFVNDFNKLFFKRSDVDI